MGPRKFRASGKTVQQIMAERDIGLLEAKHLWQVTALLDGADKATTVDDLRSIISAFITLQTGIE